MMEATLEREGHEVVAVESGMRCLDLIATQKFDVLVTDFFMPDVDGIALIMAAQVTSPGLPIIGVTGGEVSMRAPFLNAMQAFGVGTVLIKPFSPKILIDAVEAALLSAEHGYDAITP